MRNQEIFERFVHAASITVWVFVGLMFLTFLVGGLAVWLHDRARRKRNAAEFDFLDFDK